jgi:hypothetical protein
VISLKTCIHKSSTKILKKKSAKKINYMNNRNEFTFMKVEEGFEVIGNNLCLIICAVSWIDGQRCKRRC